MGGTFTPVPIWDTAALGIATHRETFDAGAHSRMSFQWHLDSSTGVISAINFYVSSAPSDRLEVLDPSTNKLWIPAPVSWGFSSLPTGAPGSAHLQVCCYSLSCVMIEAVVDTATEQFSLYGLGQET